VLQVKWLAACCLETQFELRLLARDAIGNTPPHVRADILDWQALKDAMSGAAAVLHLAVAPGHSGIHENDAFDDERFDINVKGTPQCSRRPTASACFT
jgi:nucleoside-diphosphate-sugar epimerase